ncbi:MAG: AMP-binding protein, partial [Acidimicrobiia bacterium]
MCEQRRLTFAEVDRRSTRLAHHLAGHGIGPGDHVALYLYNGTEYLEAMLAAFKLRAVPVNVNYRYGTDELRYLLADADARAIVYHAELGSRLAPLRPELPMLQAFVRVDDGTASDPSEVALGTTDYEAALAANSAVRDFGPRSADDLYVLYTGGTTGMPKGVMWRHEDVFFGALGGGGGGGAPISEPTQLAERAHDRRGLRCLPACPFMHGTAHWMALGALLTGG